MKHNRLNIAMAVTLVVLAMVSIAQHRVVNIYRGGEVIQSYDVSEVDSVKVEKALPQVTNVQATLDNGTIIVTWDVVEDATIYEVYRSGNNVDYTLLSAQVTEPIYADAEPLMGDNYYKVRAIGEGISGKLSEASNVVNTTPEVVTTPPAKVEATLDNNQIIVGWDAVEGAKAYEVYRSEDNIDYSLIASDVVETVYFDTKIQMGNAYTYKVSTIGEKGVSEMSEASNEVYIKFPDMDVFTDIQYDDMVYVEGGTYLMGAQKEDPNAPNYDADARDNASPVHSVTLSSFYIGKYEVTQGLFNYVLNYSGKAADGTEMTPSATGSASYLSEEYGLGDNYPLYGYAFTQFTNVFISRINQITGKTFRLATEAEWEYAARGGNRSRGYLYSGSNNIDDVSWYKENATKSQPVGTKQPNELGIYDMTGNIFEFCSDWSDDDYYSVSPTTNPTGPETGTRRVIRGGCWYSQEYFHRVSVRVSSEPTSLVNNYGFRLVCVPEEGEIPGDTTQYLLPAPANVQATLSDNMITVTWDAVEGAATYDVYRSGDDVVYQLYTPDIVGTSLIDAGPLNGNNYYKIRAVCDEGTSKLSEASNVVNYVNENDVSADYTDIFISMQYDDMVIVKGGTFSMGAQAEDPESANYDVEADLIEMPVHTVMTNTFYMGKYEVTQALWEYVMSYDGKAMDGTQMSAYEGGVWLGDAPDSEPGVGDNLPAYNVSYEDIVKIFIPRLYQITGRNFRLPTEAEWEYAARGGMMSSGSVYSGSSTVDDVAWYKDNTSSKVQHVGKKQPNELGIYDMSGNVHEWCSDFYDGNYYATSPEENPTGPQTGTNHVLRGGCWYNVESSCRVSYRNNNKPDYRNDGLGFRLACDM